MAKATRDPINGGHSLMDKVVKYALRERRARGVGGSRDLPCQPGVATKSTGSEECRYEHYPCDERW